MTSATQPYTSNSGRLKAGGGGARWRRSDQTRNRILLAVGAFAIVYSLIIGRLVFFGIMELPPTGVASDPNAGIATSRPDLVDRNGEILATDIKMASLYAEPRNIIDPDEAAELITSVLPDLSASKLRKKLSGKAGFAWVKREITPTQRTQIHDLGIPGIGFLTENRRFYPGGPASAHIVGLVNVDNQGIAGIEKHVDDNWLGDLHQAGFARGEELDPVELSIDVRVQHILRDEILGAIERYKAIAATGVVLDVETGEVLAMVSYPDFDPNDPVDANRSDRLNRMSAGAFEVGSVFKIFTLAMALDSGVVSLNDRVDASKPIRSGRFTINDFHGKYRVLSVPEVFIYSSNIGSARLALEVGSDYQQDFLNKLGLTSRIKTDLPEIASPIVPKKWTDLTTMTVAFGHGIAVTPLQVAVADAALVNGGKLIPPTFMKRSREAAAGLAEQVVSAQTSDAMRYLVRLNVERGSGRRAEVEGYRVGGKTGTAEKVEDGRYSASKRLNSFLAAFPMDDPKYVVFVVIDEPKPEKEGLGATAARNAAPTVRAVIRRSAALLGVAPRQLDDLEEIGTVGPILVSN
jgi:cell division protein FtsI (penicillin-binding protein 3)